MLSNMMLAVDHLTSKAPLPPDVNLPSHSSSAIHLSPEEQIWMNRRRGALKVTLNIGEQVTDTALDTLQDSHDPECATT